MDTDPVPGQSTQDAVKSSTAQGSPHDSALQSTPATPQKMKAGMSKSKSHSKPTTPASKTKANASRSGTDSPAKIATPGSAGGATAGAEEDDEDDERMDAAFIQSFADKIQHVPEELLGDGTAERPKISIPKRGEKDFEPLAETVNLQAMMLENSRQALFDALLGVRGVAGKSLSHALVTPSSPFPRLLVSRGHVLDTMGITVRRDIPDAEGSKARTISSVELLPEEALYLAERGTLQIWNGRDADGTAEEEEGIGQWSDEEFGVRGAVEMSVMEAFGVFIGREGLTWQRYQAYAYLKRLGYTVHRCREFIPRHFLQPAPELPSSGRRSVLSLMTDFWTWIRRVVCRAVHVMKAGVRHIADTGLGLARSGQFRHTALYNWKGESYSSLFAHLRFVPGGHTHAVPSLPSLPTQPATSQADSEPSIYAPLTANPYLPFFHIWKPVTQWSKARWDRGSPTGLAAQKPDYILAVVESRDTPLPTLSQLDEVFRLLPDEPTGPVKRVGPQYEGKGPRPQARPSTGTETARTDRGWLARLWPFSAPKSTTSQPQPQPRPGNAMNSLRNGDRALIVAVNDSGNTAYIRFGRSGFSEWPMV